MGLHGVGGVNRARSEILGAQDGMNCPQTKHQLDKRVSGSKASKFSPMSILMGMYPGILNFKIRIYEQMAFQNGF